MLQHVFIAVGQRSLHERLRRGLRSPDLAVHIVPGQEHVWERLAGDSADFIIISRDLIPEPPVENIRYLHHLPDCPGVVVLSEHDNAQERAEFLTAGCDAVLNTSLPASILCSTISAILDRKRSNREAELAGHRLTTQARLHDFVSHSPAMQTFMSVVKRVVNSEVPLLIQGETGVGKERLARAIHAEGPNSSGPFVAVNCGALPETLLESELFGHEQGAFTGATRSRRGCFELAHLGTIFLDEIGEMPLHLQVRLLRVLQDYEVQPIGSEKPIKIKVRLTASTNRQLEQEAQKGRFRKDLYYRLSVVSLTIPPLRQRREDIPLLVQSYIDFLRQRIGSGRYEITPETLKALCEYQWPGNVRELINVLERAMLLCNRDEITINDLPESIGNRRSTFLTDPAGVSGLQLLPALDGDIFNLTWRSARRRIVDHYEREYLARLLQQAGGRVGETAKRAGMRPRSLFYKLKKHQLRKEEFKK